VTWSALPLSYIVKILQPILDALMDKRLRERILRHVVPKSQILGVCLVYSFGFLKYMLPTEMEGPFFSIGQHGLQTGEM
jgi:hypothetical protein